MTENSAAGDNDRHQPTHTRQGQNSNSGCALEISERRIFLKAALLAGIGLPWVEQALADESPEANERPQAGDRFVFSEGEHQGTEIKPSDLALGGPPVLAWPKDSKSGIVRDGSRLNQVLLLRLDPTTFDEATRRHAAGGFVAYSAICTHQQCPVTGWVEDQARDEVLLPQLRI